MRKSKTVKINDRNVEKTFRIEEMPALQLDEWVTRSIMVLGAAGLQVPEGQGISSLGELVATQGVAMLLQGMVRADYAKARPLLNELLECCWIVIDKFEKRLTVDIVNDHIEDWKTISRLRMEALQVNLGFSFGGAATASDSPVRPLGGTA